MFLKVRLLIVLPYDYYAFIQHNPFIYEGKHLLYNFEWRSKSSHFPLVLYTQTFI